MWKYDRAFFALQWAFALRVAALGGLEMADALRKYTNFYLIFGLDRNWSKEDPLWQEYLAGLSSEPDPIDWSYSFYQRQAQEAGQPQAGPFGCFSYNYDHYKGVLNLHFRPIDTAGVLRKEREGERRAELKLLFSTVREKHRGVETVQGTSWLYNLEAYRRLFPPAYIAKSTVAEGEFRFLARWGQFLDREGRVKPAPAALFQTRLAQVEGLTNLAGCFPFQPLSPHAPFAEFKTFYGR